jgi:hypothetical protein
VTSGTEPGAPGAGAGANGGGLSWENPRVGPRSLQLAPGSGWVLGLTRRAAMNWSMRSSPASASLSWCPQDCSEIGWSRPGYGDITM